MKFWHCTQSPRQWLQLLCFNLRYWRTNRGVAFLQLRWLIPFVQDWEMKRTQSQIEALIDEWTKDAHP